MIAKCMKIARSKVPLYRNPWFWLGVGIPLIILLILLLIYLAPHPECTIDSDCPRGYECSDEVCVKTVTETPEPEIQEQPEPEVITEESVCGDGYCDSGESCVPDCGCVNSIECSDYYGNVLYVCVDGTCEKSNFTGSSGMISTSDGSSSEADCSDGEDNEGDGATDCEDSDCVTDSACTSEDAVVEGTCADEDCGTYVCETDSTCYGSCNYTGDWSECAYGSVCDSSGACVSYACSNYVDDDGDGLVDYFGACDTDSDGVTDSVCGCDIDADGIFSSEEFIAYADCDTSLYSYGCDTSLGGSDTDRSYDTTITCTESTDSYSLPDSACTTSETDSELSCTDEDCAPYACDPSLDGSCYNSCTEDSSCAEEYSCEEGICVGDCDYLSSSSELLPPDAVDNPYVDLAFDSDDVPSVTVQYYDFATSEQVFSLYTLSSGAWSESEIARSSSGSYFSSLAIGTDTLPRVVYQLDDTGDPLYYATYDGSAWTVESFADEGIFPIMEIDQSNLAHVLYADNTLGELVYAVETSTGWEKTTLATIDPSTEIFYAWDMVLDSEGLPHVVYAVDSTTASTGVIYSQVYDGSTWTSAEEVVSGDSVVPLSLHMAFDSDGNPLLVYSHGSLGTLAYGSYDGRSWTITDFSYTSALLSSIAFSPNEESVIVYWDYSSGDVYRLTLSSGSWNRESLFTRVASITTLPVFAYDSERNFHLVSYDYETTLAYVAYYTNDCYAGSVSEDCSSPYDEDGDSSIGCADSDCLGELGPSGELCENPESTCDDGSDNDADGATDCDDDDCASDAACISVITTETDCSDGVDEDSDGSTDCDDSDCASDATCISVITTETDCSDGVDEDSDGATDCDDSDCASDTACPACSETLPTCADGVDNDGDGFADLEDPSCTTWTDDEGLFFCTETDTGDDLYTAGTITNPYGSSTDYCPFTDTLQEYYCSGDTSSSMYHDCTYGCITGADGGYCSPTCTDDSQCEDGYYCDGSACVHTECADSIDNDGDGDTDYPDDFSCDSISDSSEACETDTDCATGADCDVVTGDCIQFECSDGIDNEGDGDADYYGACALSDGSFLSCPDLLALEGITDLSTLGDPENVALSCAITYCSKSTSHGGYGGTYLARDDQCDTSSDDSEACQNDSDCPVGVCNDDGICELSKECNDGDDNDGDGEIDYPTDNDCSSSSDDQEAECLTDSDCNTASGYYCDENDGDCKHAVDGGPGPTGGGGLTFPLIDIGQDAATFQGLAPENEQNSWQSFWRFIIDGYFAVHGQEHLNYPAPALESSALDTFREYGK